MTIKVALPTISMMKMEYRSHIQLNIPSKGFTLPEIKKEIFNRTWEILEQWSPKGIHGTSDHVILMDEYDVEIIDDDQLKDRLNKSLNFSAVFKEHQNLNSFFSTINGSII